MLDSLSAIPDGSGVIYSRRRGQRQGRLRAVPGPAEGRQAGGDHEHAARRIRSGRLARWQPVAHVSNHLGNIDLFTMPIAGGEKKHVEITGLKFRKPSRPPAGAGTRRKGQADAGAPVRAGLRRQGLRPQGRADLLLFPRSATLHAKAFSSASGDDTFPVPAGKIAAGRRSRASSTTSRSGHRRCAPRARPRRSPSHAALDQLEPDAAGTPARITSTPITTASYYQRPKESLRLAGGRGSEHGQHDRRQLRRARSSTIRNSSAARRIRSRTAATCCTGDRSTATAIRWATWLF